MTHPQRYLIRMVVFLVIVAGACAALLPRLLDAFAANPLLNGLIAGVLLLGIVYIFWQVISLRQEVAWLDNFRRESSGSLVFPRAISDERPPRLLSPMAKMMGDRKGRLSLSTLTLRSLLDGIQSRIEESHDISRYMIGLLIFLGLLGTFWGLLETVSAVGDTIAGLSVTGNEPAGMFEELKRGLETPLSGMGTAFSSSLFGLAGSLILGFLELQAGQAHNRFVNDLEEWLSGVTKLSHGSSMGEGEQPIPVYIQALLEQTADSLDQLQRTIARSEADRSAVNRNLESLTEKLTNLTDHMRTEQSVMLKVAESHAAIRPVLAKLSDQDFSEFGLDEATRNHIRNLDHRMERLASDVSSGRDSAVEELRSEIRLLTRTIAALAEEESRQ